MTAPLDDPSLVRRERDLYARLLNVGVPRDLRSLLVDALQIAVQTTGARRGYLAVFAPDHPDAGSPRWSTAWALDPAEVANVEHSISHGIIAHTLDEGQLVETHQAWLDPRFSGHESVIRGEIEAVLCAAIGQDPKAILYLNRDTRDGPFTPADKHLVTQYAEWLRPAVHRLLLHAEPGADPTAPYRVDGRFSGVIGRTPAVARMLSVASRYADLPDNLLLTGASGLGKTHLAEQIHNAGRRRTGPFFQVNCGALGPGVLEAELFGVRAGVVTSRETEGVVVAAEGGTLFLDEITTIPIEKQASLLHFVERRVYRRVGDAKTRQADVRLIFATNQDPDKLVEQGLLRFDLLQRIRALTLHVPSIAERADDIPLLLDGLGRRLATHYDREWPGLTPRALNAALAHAWSGGVREMENALRRALAHGTGAPIEAVELLELPALDRLMMPQAGAEGIRPWREAMAEYERAYFLTAYAACGGSMTRLAASLGMRRSSVYEMKARYLGDEG